jgi:hypothetical protein
MNDGGIIPPRRNVMLTDDYLKARGAVAGTEPAEDVIRRLRDGTPVSIGFESEIDEAGDPQFTVVPVAEERLDHADIFYLDVPEHFAFDAPGEEHRTAFVHTLEPGAFVEAFRNQLDDAAWSVIDDAVYMAARALGYEDPPDGA